MPFDVDTRNAFLNWAFGKTSLALSTRNKVYIGLSSTKPEKVEGDDTSGVFTELTGDTYARVLISQYNNTYPAKMSTASGGAIYNVEQINWNKATAAWPLIQGYGLFTELTGGTPYYYTNLDLTEEQETAGGVAVTSGAVMLFDPESLEIKFPEYDVSTAAATASL